jgi:predicted amidohydrolase
MTTTWRIGLAALRHPSSISEGVDRTAEALQRGASEGARVVCFPETYLPGLRGVDVELPPPDQRQQQAALECICAAAGRWAVAGIAGLEWVTELGLQNWAHVFSSDGQVLGYQTKSQITPVGESEDYVPDGLRRVFHLDGVTFGIDICHGGWRYPETVR